MEDTGAALALPVGIPVRLEALVGKEEDEEEDEGTFLAE